MRLRALFRTGFRLAAGSCLAQLAADVAGFQAPWLSWAVAVFFTAGAVDMGIALAHTRLTAGGRAGTGPARAPGAREKRREQDDFALVLSAQEKRLMPPPSPSRQGSDVEFPGSPEYSWRDRLGRLQPPFPVHYRTLPPEVLTEGAPIGDGVREAHSDPHDGCPACEAWRARVGR
jgi:hypothetical protein